MSKLGRRGEKENETKWKKMKGNERTWKKMKEIIAGPNLVRGRFEIDDFETFLIFSEVPPYKSEILGD